MACQRMEGHARGKVLLHVIRIRLKNLTARRSGVRVIKEKPVGVGEHVRVVVGGAAKHHAVNMRHVLPRLSEGRNTTIDNDFQVGPLVFEAINEAVAQRRHIAVFLRAQTLKMGLAGMNGERGATGVRHRLHERSQIVVGVVVVDADAAFHRYRNVGGAAHGGDTRGNEGRLGH